MRSVDTSGGPVAVGDAQVEIPHIGDVPGWWTASAFHTFIPDDVTRIGTDLLADKAATKKPVTASPKNSSHFDHRTQMY
ncbi:hypothetical protein UA75_04615 [Actinoalloteichus sp. GBA129-24]|nr:hypothetical protein UA75_04615 [Actinoalloteichus sp. GBA129-24]